MDEGGFEVVGDGELEFFRAGRMRVFVIAGKIVLLVGIAARSIDIG